MLDSNVEAQNLAQNEIPARLLAMDRDSVESLLVLLRMQNEIFKHFKIMNVNAVIQFKVTFRCRNENKNCTYMKHARKVCLCVDIEQFRGQLNES